MENSLWMTVGNFPEEYNKILLAGSKISTIISISLIRNLLETFFSRNGTKTFKITQRIRFSLFLRNALRESMSTGIKWL